MPMQAMPTTREGTSLDVWLMHAAAGQYVRAWQQQHYDRAVQDVFGYYALHVGALAVDALRNNRIAHGWHLCGLKGLADGVTADAQSNTSTTTPTTTPTAQADSPGETGEPGEQDCGFPRAPDLVAAPEALPFAADQFDLIVMPHALESCHQPQAALREATRVLRPQGRLIVSGFNPARLLPSLRPALPRQALGEAIGPMRLRDWLDLLDFDVQESHFGCSIPRFQNPRWYERLQWMDRWMERLTHERLPLLGGMYFFVAVKKVAGARLLETQWKAWEPQKNIPLVPERTRSKIPK